ncbi:MAG: hypothetical protein H6733_10245 [Alphaproteobacteria bacterium]|nr:hypothetical protein [Alphaproteobacteria bacterium]
MTVLPFDLADYDPGSAEQGKAIDTTFGLPPGIPFGCRHYVAGARVASSFRPEGGSSILEEVAAPFPWLSTASPEDRERARAQVDVLLGRVYEVDRLAWSWHVEIEDSRGRVTQVSIARREGLTQPSVCHRIAVARERMAIAALLPDLPVGSIRDAVVEGLPRREDRAVAADWFGLVAETYYWVPNQIAVGRMYGRSQGWARYLISVALSALGPDHPLWVVHTRWPGAPSMASRGRTPSVYRGDGERRVRELREQSGLL